LKKAKLVWVRPSQSRAWNRDNGVIADGWLSADHLIAKRFLREAEQWHATRSARGLGVGRTTLYRMLRDHGVSRRRKKREFRLRQAASTR